MKKLYLFVFIVVCLIAIACSKDSFKRYEKRIQGTWRLTDVDRRGIGGNTANLPFTEGEFTFDEDGGLTWINSAGAVYKGSWDIRRQLVSDGCTTNDDGNTHCSSHEINTLSVMAIDFVSQQVKKEFFDEMVFSGTHHFKGYVHSGLHTYVLHFRR